MSRAILTARAIRAAEQRAIDGESSVDALMERAGQALAEAVRLLAGAGDVLLLCGPGNNGGDGYVAARHLATMGFAVRVAASAAPTTDAAKAAAQGWGGSIEALADAAPAAILVDCLFGTGLRKPLEDAVFKRLNDLVAASRLSIACDLPSGVAADSGACLSPIPRFDLTVALGALKPAHRLMPAMPSLGRVAVADLGLDTSSDWHEIGAPILPALEPGGHKYDRGLVHLLAGQMPGAIALAARAAAAGGAGYVRVSTSRAIDNLPSAIVQTETAEVNDPKIGCLLVGPGLGDIPPVLTLALTSKAPIVIDADAIGLVGDPERLTGQDAILTPHDGEFAKLFGDLPSGVAADRGACLSPIPRFDLTVALGALKPAHRLMPAMPSMGRVAVADLGLDTNSDWHEIGAPILPALKPGGHKYDRGLVHLLAGQMPGAIALAARAAAAGGAGYVRVSTSRSIDNLPSAIVQTETAEVNDPKIGCLLVGPGLGDIPPVLTLALTSKAPIVIDADAIGLVGNPERLTGQDAILTPHDGEFAKLFGDLPGTKPERALEAARLSGAVIVYKGADTLVAAPDGRLGFAPPAPAWLASAGTGDVLAGLIAAMRARGLPAFEAACAAVWLHGRAAERVGPGMIADDLIAAIPHVLQ